MLSWHGPVPDHDAVHVGWPGGGSWQEWGAGGGNTTYQCSAFYILSSMIRGGDSDAAAQPRGWCQNEYVRALSTTTNVQGHHIQGLGPNLDKVTKCSGA